MVSYRDHDVMVRGYKVLGLDHIVSRSRCKSTMITVNALGEDRDKEEVRQSELVCEWERCIDSPKA